MTTEAQLRVLAGASPKLLCALAQITTQARTSTPQATPTQPPAQAPAQTPALPSAVSQGGWQQHWIQDNNTPTSAPLAGHLILHPEVPAVRLSKQEGEWAVPGVGMASDKGEQRVTFGERQYSVEIGVDGTMPENVRDHDTAWVMAGDQAPWGISVSSEAAVVLDSLHQSSRVPGWQAEWMSVEPSRLASVLVFGPYAERVSAYEAAVADAAPDDEVMSLAVDVVDSDVVVLGFGTNLPSTRRPMTRAGRTS